MRLVCVLLAMLPAVAFAEPPSSVAIADYLQHSIDVRDTEVRWLKDYVEGELLPNALNKESRAKALRWQQKLKLASDPKTKYYSHFGKWLAEGQIGTFLRPMQVVEILGPQRVMFNWEFTQVDEVTNGMKGSDGRLLVTKVRIHHQHLVILPLSSKGLKAGDIKEVDGVWYVVGKEKVGRDTAYACELIPAKTIAP